MKKTTVDLTLGILLIVAFFFTNLYALPFIGGILIGDYLIAKHNWMGLNDEVEEKEESWASQFEINRIDSSNKEENE